MIEILNGIQETVRYDSYSGIRLYHNTAADDYPLHWHTAMEIIMPVRNGYTIVANDEPHDIGEGDIWIMPPGTLHALIAPKSGSGERLIMLFDYSLICNVKGMDSLIHCIRPYGLIKRSEHPELSGQLCGYLNEICREYDNQMPFAEARIYALVINFFVSLGRSGLNTGAQFPGIASGRQHIYIEKFMNVCNFINEHCTENVTVEELANVAGFSKFHFSRLFKQFSGMSCCEYLTQKRIAYAETLLIQPNISITDAAMRSGFGSLSSFNRIFKTAKNCTPSEYKRLNQA